MELAVVPDFDLIDDFADKDGPSIMDACDLLALPSVEESFGMVMIEAWMCGKPVIGADIASTRCIVEPGINGLTVPPFDSAALAAKIIELLSDPVKRARFGERGRAKVRERYTWDRVTDVWEATFRQAASHGPPDFLVNNAAVINRNAPLWEVSPREFSMVRSA